MDGGIVVKFTIADPLFEHPAPLVAVAVYVVVEDGEAYTVAVGVPE